LGCVANPQVRALIGRSFAEGGAELNYRAALNLDYTAQQSNEYQKLIAALRQAGWTYVETSALVVETDDLAVIWRGIELVAKQSASAGTLSALTLHVQGSNNFGGVPYNGAANHPNALQDIQQKPYP
jgi:hypothetical protein